jgi:hypothetical protein
MVGVDSEIGSSVLRLWVAAGAAAALVAVCALAFLRMRATAMSDTTRAGGVVLGAILGAGLTWALLSHAALRDHDAERRTLETRAQELSARALSPGSALACLDAVAGDSVDAACEKALFASPAAVATATSYAAARLELLADMAAYIERGGTDIDRLLVPLRHSVEIDSYGFLAHALAIRDGCTAADCKALDVLGNASRVRANLSGQTLDHYLDRYLTAWAQPADAPVAAAAAVSQPATPSQPGAPGQRKVVVNIDFPTSASIPAVSIMNPEPGTKGAPPAGTAAAAGNPSPSIAAAPGAPPQQPKKPRKQAAAPPPPPAAPPVPPQTLSADGQEDPVWTPAPVAPPAQAAATVNAPAANFVGPR